MGERDGFDEPTVEVIGDVQASRRGQTVPLQPGQRQLLALLVAVGPSGASPDKLADEIWGERLPGNWPNSLRVAVHRLRKRAGIPVVSEGGRYRLELPTSAVDAWLLDQVVDGTVDWRPDMEHLLSSPTCFPSVEPSPSILEAATAIGVAQRQLIERLATLDAGHRRSFLGQLMTHVVDDPTDDRLVHAVATVLARSGSSAEALGLIERCRRERRRIFETGIAPDLDALEQKIRTQTVRVEPAAPPERHRQLPLQLERYRREGLVGREDVLAELRERLDGDGTPTIAVQGPAGVGKTALLAELAHRSSGDTHVLYVTGAETNAIGLSPLMTGVPGFAADVERERGEVGQQDGRLGRLAQRFIELAETQAANRPTLLLIDDVQWLDSQTCEVLDYVLRAEAGRLVTGVVTAKRSGTGGKVPARSLEIALDRLTDVSSLDLPPLTTADVERALGQLEPDLSFAERHQKAQWLHDASGGLPEVLRRMVDIGATPASEATDAFRVFDRIVAALGQPVRLVGVAGAVIGRRFRLSDLTELVQQTEDELADLVDVLIGHDLVVEAGSFDHFEFRHQLIVDAFLRSSSKTRLARFHLRACGLSSADVHAISRHRVASGTLSDPDVTFQAVLDSAEQHLSNREFWESASEFRTAIGLDGAELEPRAYVDYATAVSLTGSVRASRSVRERAYAAAVSAGAWDLAIDAARSGLPEAEIPDGEADRLDQLEGVSPDRLSPSHRLAQALTAARLASQLGRVERSRHWAARATASAHSDEERGEAALCRRFVQMVDRPAAVRLEQLDGAIGQLDLPNPLQCRASQFRAVDHLELGTYERSTRQHRRFAELASSTNDSMRQWHALVFGALLAELRADFQEADRLADAAHQLGHRHAIAQAEIVRLAQHFFRSEALGQLDDLLDLMGLIPVTDADSTLFSAATTRVLMAAGQDDEAGRLAGELASDLLARPTVTSHGSMALLAPALAGRCSATLREGALASLEPFRGGGMVIGVGLGYIPSVEHLWMLLNDSSTDGRISALVRAIDDCDSAGLIPWSVRYRLDLAELTDSGEPVEQARRLAAGTDLARLFADDDLAA